MARIRNIKPEFFTSEKIGSLTVLSRLLFVALWCQADRNGNMKFSRVALAAQCMPYEFDQFDGCLVELTAAELVAHYEVDSKRYLHIRGFVEHQRPHHTEPKSNIPPPIRFNTENLRVETENLQAVAENLGQEREGERERERELKTHQQQRAGAGEAAAAGVLERCFDAHEADIVRLFPLVNFAVEKALCSAHYRSRSPPVDPWPVVLKWLRRSRSDVKGGQDGAGSSGQIRAGRAPGIVSANGPDADWLGGSQFASLAGDGSG